MYEFALFQRIRLHPVFHVSFLESISLQTLLQTSLKVKEDEIEYEIEKILDYKGSSRREEYFIKWKGYNTVENIWKSKYHLKNF